MDREAIREAALALRKALPVRWGMVRPCHLPERRLGEPYYARFDPGAGIYGEYWDQFDSEGILHKGNYNPVSIAQYALYCYERALEGDADSRRAFIRHVEYLRRDLRPDGTLPFDFPLPDFHLSPGWISGMSQGEAASVFLRAFALTADERYREAAISALKPLERSTAAGGATFMRDADVFFEEVPGLPTHILNGHLWAAFGVWEACEYGLASGTLRELHQASIETLVRWLPLYDDDGWSYYQLGARGYSKRHYVPITYHQTHINQLRVYAAMTGRDEFAVMAQRWRNGLDRWDVRARVWSDALQRLSQAALRRIRNAPVGSWHVLHGRAAEH